MYPSTRAFPHLLYRPLALLFLLTLGVAACGRANSEDTGSDAVTEDNRFRIGDPIDDSTHALIVASEYGKDTLTTAGFQSQIQNFVLRFRQPLDETQLRQLRRDVAESFIRRHVFRGEARHLGLEADAAGVEEQIDLIISQNRMEGREALEQALALQGMTLDSLRSILQEEMAMGMLQEQMLEGASDPTHEELEAFRHEQAQQVRAQHILFAVPEPSQEEAVVAKATAILDSAKAGTDFEALARRHSEGPSAPNGGDLGFFSKPDMVPAFSDAAFALADSGDIAPELVQSQFGYHIIRLAGRRTAALMDSTQAHARLMQERQREAVEEGYHTLAQKVVVHVNEKVIDADLNAPRAG